MIANKFVQDFARLESEIAAKRGDFVLFALFMREESAAGWDLIVAAPWIGGFSRESVQFFVDEIKSLLGAQALTSLSRIIVFDPYHKEVLEFNRAVEVEHGDIEIRDRDIFGQTIREAHVITSKLPAAPVVQQPLG